MLGFVPFEDVASGELYLGWDLGRERDHNAIAVIQKVDDYMQLIHCKQFPLGTPYVTVMSYIKSLCDRWKYVRAVYYDHTGTKGMDEEILKCGFPGTVGIDFTKPVKHGMAMALKQMMMTARESDKALLPQDARRKFELPLDQDVQAELNVEQWEQTAGSEVYTFSHPEGSHDDRFWAICMAVKASMQSPPPGVGAVMLQH
jgi:phage FluMu gp28-like protein